MKKKSLVGLLLCTAFLSSCGIFDEPSPSTPVKDSTPNSEPAPSLPNSEDPQPSVPAVPSENPQPSVPAVPSENPQPSVPMVPSEDPVDSSSTQGPIKVDDVDSTGGHFGPLH